MPTKSAAPRKLDELDVLKHDADQASLLFQQATKNLQDAKRNLAQARENFMEANRQQAAATAKLTVAQSLKDVPHDR